MTDRDRTFGFHGLALELARCSALAVRELEFALV